MVGIVLVSHSRALALSVQELIRSMTGPLLPLAVAAGAGPDHQELGTDAVEIAEAIRSVHGPDGVVVLMDMGSAILSAETALDLLEESFRTRVRFCAAPFVEGAVAAGVTANLGAPLDDVYTEALAALKQKEVALHLPPGIAVTPSPSETGNLAGTTAPSAVKARVTVRNAHGLHARPAARLISEARSFHSEITVRNLTNHRGPVSVRSLSSLATLEILPGNEVEFAARGDDASVALEKITQLVESGLGDEMNGSSNGAAGPRLKSVPARTRKGSAKSSGPPVPVSDGLVVGPSLYFQATDLEIPRHEAGDVTVEINRLQTAVATTQKSLESLRDQMTTTVGPVNAGIYEAQILALQDPDLIESACRAIREKRINAALAWDSAIRQVAARYEALRDSYLRERAADLEDVGRQVLELLVARKSTCPAFTAPRILIADNLTPFQVSALSPNWVLGVILLDGGPTAHCSILLRALGIPTIVQARAALAGIDRAESKTIAFDGSTGKIWLDPDDNFLAELRQRQAAERQREQEERAASFLPGATRDGHRIEIFANMGGVSEVGPALLAGAEGVGLLRTEFLFLDRDTAPTEEDQREALVAVAEKMEGRPVIVRTLDIGGDKPVPYLPMASEENPFLGVRALRLCFSQGELFATQLRAILRAGHGRDLRIMFPMVANVTDLDRAQACLEKAHRDLEAENVPHLWPIQTGIMIEIPSAALQAGLLARQVDFFSIGTNDLTQYTLAADRGNPDLAAYQDALHPSVLRLIEMVVLGARQHDRPVAVCGEAAADEQALAVLAGLGVLELSLSGAKIPRVKATLRKHTLADLQRLAQAALQCRTAAEVRALQPSG